jgi:hypothetical protein
MDTAKKKFNPIRVCIWGNVIVAVIVAFWLGIYPAWVTVYSLRDPGMKSDSIPRHVVSMHRKLSPKIARWATARVQSERPATLTGDNISGTEWPVFGSVFYLWATEALQDDWEQHPEGEAPKVYAHDAIAASVALVLDPKHAAWVIKMWGEDYLTEQNAFYRACRIAALTAQVRLLEDTSNLDMLREEVERLAAEIDASPVGLLEDYPGECYPGDVAAALMCIRHADAVLGTDHSAMIARAYRGFDETKEDKPYGIPPYAAVACNGNIAVGARGCSNVYLCMTSPELWPEAAATWYARNEEHFWQANSFWAGFREFPRAMENRNWYYDVDSGPCVAGFGAAASAFGLAAARINGRFDHAWPLAAEMITVSWIMPNGRMLWPALLSNFVDAPFLGEQCILYTLSRTPIAGVEITTGGRLPLIVLVILAAYLLSAALLITLSIRAGRRAVTRPARFPLLQTLLWAIILLASITLLCVDQIFPAFLCLLASQTFPMRLWRWKAHTREQS